MKNIKINFGKTPFSRVWTRYDSLAILFTNEKDHTFHSCGGRQLKDFQYVAPFWTRHLPEAHVRALMNAVEPDWAIPSDIEYFESLSGTRYHKHFVMVRTPYIPDAFLDPTRVGYFPVPSTKEDLQKVFDSPTRAVMVRMMEEVKSRLALRVA